MDWIAMQMKMTNLVCNHDHFISCILPLEYVDSAVLAFKEAVNARAKRLAGVDSPHFKIVSLDRFGDQGFSRTVSIGFVQSLFVARTRLAANIDPRIHINPLRAISAFRPQ